MNTDLASVTLPEKAKPSRIESVKFSDGMIVNADDLDASQRYPVSLLSTVLRTYFGSGVLGGFGLWVKENADKRPNWVVCVGSGVAIDCVGYPIELCAPIEMDLSPDACACEAPPDEICIAVRRMTSEEAPKETCSCDTDAPRFDCRRIRDYVVVKAFVSADFEALPCTVPKFPLDKTPPADWAEALCTTLHAGPDCMCGDCWILLGRVKLNPKTGAGAPDTGDRKWVKPIAAICPTLIGQITKQNDQITTLRQQAADMAKQVADLAGQIAAKPEVAKPPAVQP